MDVEGSFEHSRGRGIAGQWGNFKKNPLFGIGFGVSLDKSFKPVFDEVTGLPISASSGEGIPSVGGPGRDWCHRHDAFPSFSICLIQARVFGNGPHIAMGVSHELVRQCG